MQAQHDLICAYNLHTIESRVRSDAYISSYACIKLQKCNMEQLRIFFRLSRHTVYRKDCRYEILTMLRAKSCLYLYRKLQNYINVLAL